MISMKPDKAIHTQKIKISVSDMKNGKRYTRKIPALILSPKDPKVRKTNAPGILWIHGGGYFVGMKEMTAIRHYYI